MYVGTPVGTRVGDTVVGTALGYAVGREVGPVHGELTLSSATSSPNTPEITTTAAVESDLPSLDATTRLNVYVCPATTLPAGIVTVPFIDIPFNKLSHTCPY